MKSWVVVALVGCGAAPATPITQPARPLDPIAPTADETPPPAPVRDFAPFALAHAQPAIGLDAYHPDLEELGRWPLTVAEHPSLEPHFAIASALAEPGVSWTELCARGAQHRHLSAKRDLVDYLDAWCDAAKDNYGAAITKLGRVRNATTTGLTGALRLDVAALAAAHGPAHDLENLLRHGDFLTVSEVDAVAAAYYEIGRLDDAVEANQLAAQIDFEAPEQSSCTRLLRGIAASRDERRNEAIANLQHLANPLPDHKARCTAAEHLERCALKNECGAYWADQWPGNSVGLKNLESALSRWTAAERTTRDWLTIAYFSEDAWPRRDGMTLLASALDLAVRTSWCSDAQLDDVETVLVRVDKDLRALRPNGAHADSIERFDRSDIQSALERLDQIAKRASSLRRATPDECSSRISAFPPVP